MRFSPSINEPAMRFSPSMKARSALL